MAESDRMVHYDDGATLLDSSTGNVGHPDPVRHPGHSDPVHSVRLLGSINAVMSSLDAGPHCYQRLSASVSSTASSAVPVLHVYRRRWYILFIFTTFSFVQVQSVFSFVGFLSLFIKWREIDTLNLNLVMFWHQSAIAACWALLPVLMYLDYL